MPRIREPSFVLLDTSSTTIVATASDGDRLQVTLYIDNADNAAAQEFTLYRFDDDAGDTESTNGAAMLTGRSLGAGEMFKITFNLFEGWRVTGKAANTASIHVHVDIVEF